MLQRIIAWFKKRFTQPELPPAPGPVVSPFTSNVAPRQLIIDQSNAVGGMPIHLQVGKPPRPRSPRELAPLMTAEEFKKYQFLSALEAKRQSDMERELRELREANARRRQAEDDNDLVTANLLAGLAAASEPVPAAPLYDPPTYEPDVTCDVSPSSDSSSDFSSGCDAGGGGDFGGAGSSSDW